MWSQLLHGIARTSLSKFLDGYWRGASCSYIVRTTWAGPATTLVLDGLRPAQNSGFIGKRVYNKAVTAKKCLEKILDHKSKQSKTNLMIKVSIKIQLSI